MNYLPLLVVLVVLAVIGLAVWQSRKLGARRAAHPDAPWLWREDWANGRIEPGNLRALPFLWMLAIFWNVIAWGFLATLAPRELRGGHYGILFLLLFDVAGIALLVAAVRATIRRQKFGHCLLRLLFVPGHIGGQLAGVIDVPARVRPADGFRLKLVNVRIVTRGSGKHRHTTQSILWAEEQSGVRELLQEDQRRSGIPVSFDIPTGASPSDETNSRDRIVWRLEARASVPGVDFYCQFEVPVFRVSSAGHAAPPLPAPENEPAPPVASTDGESGPGPAS